MAGVDNNQLFSAVLAIADDHLVLAHRLSEWCGHAPMLEEDLALPNIALDLLGQARVLYTYAGELEGKGRDEDQLAYLRLEKEYKNLLLVERENGDFAHTVLRLFLFASFMELYWQEMVTSKDATLAAVAAKALKETRYHVRHSAEWVIRLGDGTDESAERMADAVEELTPYCAEMFDAGAGVYPAVSEGILVDPSKLAEPWQVVVSRVFKEAMLQDVSMLDGHQRGGRKGEHSEAMGFLLADLQYMQRVYPDMVW
jgi:ring-1,2-phenylacetyl-CoA epoxidase subunit PaaC